MERRPDPITFRVPTSTREAGGRSSACLWNSSRA